MISVRGKCATLLACWVASVSAQTENTFVSNPRQLTFEGTRSGEGYFSPDGKALIFQSERETNNPFYQIYVLDMETGETRRASPGIGKTTCGFFRFGTDEVLFASTHHDGKSEEKQKAEFDFRASGKERRYSWDYDEAMDIFSSKRDGTDIRRLTTSPGYDAEGAYSPDGAKIVFCSLRDAYPTNKLSAADLKRLETDPAYFGEIYIMNADGSDAKRLTSNPGYDGGPFFSPDGQRIVWRHFDTNGTIADVYTMKLDGSDVRRLTDFGCMSWAPFFHPSGEYVVFTANKHGFSNFELFIVDAQGQHEPVRITYTDGFDGLPSFTPDGRRVTWTSSRASDGKSQIYLADWNHSAAMNALVSSRPRISLPAGHSHGTAMRASTNSAVALRRLSNDVVFLSSPKLAGRMTGSAGAQEAAEFIANRLETAGVKPFGQKGTYYHEFEFNAGVRVLTNENRLTLTATGEGSPAVFTAEKDFRPLAFTSNGVASGAVVFAGYGLSVPGKAGEGYDSYAGLNVSNKIVLAFRYVPEEVEAKRRQELNRYAGLRYKAMIARERGAKAILFVTGPNSPNAGELAALSSDSGGANSGIIVASVKTNVAAAIFAAAGHDLKEVQSQLDKENPHAVGSFVASNLTLSLTTAVEHIRKTDRNVVGVLPGTDTNEFILVGAHYDHLGYGEGGAMQRAGEENKVHPGADDNASGSAVLMQLAREIADLTKGHDDHGHHDHPAGKHDHGGVALRRGIIFAFWSGEEMGLLGSAHFAEHSSLPMTNIVACLNFDMVGRLRENRLILQGIGSSTAWKRAIEKRNVAAGFNLVLQDDPYLPTDVTSFYPRGIPVLNFFTGSHDDYHRPTDTADKVNFDGMERIVKFARALITDTATAPQRPDYARVAASDKGGGSRENLRAYLGTIPDYATEIQGVKISGVRAGSPAEKAGIKGGDVIVEFAGQKVANIYDYTYALDAVKIGQPIDIVVTRAGQRVTLKATPEARK